LTIHRIDRTAGRRDSEHRTRGPCGRTVRATQRCRFVGSSRSAATGRTMGRGVSGRAVGPARASIAAGSLPETFLVGNGERRPVSLQDCILARARSVERLANSAQRVLGQRTRELLPYLAPCLCPVARAGFPGVLAGLLRPSRVPEPLTAGVRHHADGHEQQPGDLRRLNPIYE
jgi:hypothetical protein